VVAAAIVSTLIKRAQPLNKHSLLQHMSDNSVDKLIKKIQCLQIQEDCLCAQQSRLLRELADAIDDELQQGPPVLAPTKPQEEQDDGAPKAFD